MWLPELLKYLISHPPKYLKKWIVEFIHSFIKNPILTILILAILFYLLPVLLFRHENSHFIEAADNRDIIQTINTSLIELGNGATITRIAIGKEFYEEDKVSFAFDIVRTCDEAMARFRNSKNCVVNTYWLNSAYREVVNANKSTIDFLNKDLVNIGSRKNLAFAEGDIIWFNIFDDDGKNTGEGSLIEALFPDLHSILEKMKRRGVIINKIAITKVRHRIFKNVIYLFTLSFWRTDNGYPEIHESNKRYNTILKNVAYKQKTSPMN